MPHLLARVLCLLHLPFTDFTIYNVAQQNPPKSKQAIIKETHSPNEISLVQVPTWQCTGRAFCLQLGGPYVSLVLHGGPVSDFFFLLLRTMSVWPWTLIPCGITSFGSKFVVVSTTSIHAVYTRHTSRHTRLVRLAVRNTGPNYNAGQR